MNKSRSFIYMVVCVLLASALVLSACQPAPATEEAVEEAAPAEEEPVEEVEEAEEVEEPAEPQEPLTVAFVFMGTVQDYGYNQMWNEGRMAMDDFFGDEVETLIVEGATFSEETTRLMEQLIADGAEVIVDIGGFMDFTTAAAEAHPEVEFLTINPAVLDNMTTYMWEAGRSFYLYGAAAGLLTETDNIGFVVAFPGSFSYGWLDAIALGAQSVNPDATVTAAYVGSWYDPPASRQAAEALANSGVDVFVTYTDISAVMEVAEQQGAFVFGRYLPMAQFAPNSYATTVLMDSSGLYTELVQALLDGSLESGPDAPIHYLAFENGFSLDDWGPNVPQEVQDQIGDLYNQMVDGYNPLVGPIYDSEGNLVVADGEELTEYPNFYFGLDWLVDGVISSQ